MLYIYEDSDSDIVWLSIYGDIERKEREREREREKFDIFNNLLTHLLLLCYVTVFLHHLHKYITILFIVNILIYSLK